MRPTLNGIVESSLYVDIVELSRRFYEDVLGFSLIADFGTRGCAMDAGNQHVLLLFQKNESRANQSPHFGDGELHIAFPVTKAELAEWEKWLSERGIHIEERRTWTLGGESIYFRDPDRHLLELVTPGTWTIY